MGIGKTAALLAAAAGTVALGAGSAEAGGFHRGENGGQFNHCTSFSLVNLGRGPSVHCLNYDRTSDRHRGGGPQVNDCDAHSAASTLGNLIFFPFEGPSAHCANIRT